MTKLLPYLQFDHNESVLGYAARLAAFHTGGRSAPFLRDIGVEITDLARGQTDAIHRLADISGIDPDVLGANAPQCLGRRHFHLRGEAISSEFLATPYTVFCPKCLQADDEVSGGRAQFRRHRWIWQFRVVRTCPDHGIPLMRRMAGFSGDRFHELAIMVPETGEELMEISTSITPRPVSPLQDYVLNRLVGAKGPNWLDGEGIDQAVRATEMLGVLMLFGPKPNLDKLTEDDWDQAGGIGFAYTAQDEAGIRSALSKVQARIKDTNGQQGPQHVFGRLYQWLAQSRTQKEPGDIMRILREHIIETMEFPAGAIVMGQKLEERRLHTCASLARETGLDPRTLRGLLAAHGLMPEDQSQGLKQVFDAQHGEKIARLMPRLVPLTTLPKRLNCSRPLAEDFVSERILTPIVTEVSHAAGRMKKAVEAGEIDSLLMRLKVQMQQVDDLPSGMVDLATAAMKSNCSAVEIVHLILGGHVSNAVWIKGFEGLAAIHVDPVETKSAVAELLVGLPPVKAFGKIRIPVSSGWELVKRSLLPVISIPASQGGHVVRRFCPQDVDKFISTYTTEVRIGEILGIGVGDLKSKMKAAGAKPFLTKTDIGIRIFERQNLPQAFKV
jgi:hypothetical protein